MDQPAAHRRNCWDSPLGGCLEQIFFCNPITFVIRIPGICRDYSTCKDTEQLNLLHADLSKMNEILQDAVIHSIEETISPLLH